MADKTITMKKSSFMKEHKSLIKLLSMGQKFVDEAKQQEKEMKSYLKKKWKK